MRTMMPLISAVALATLAVTPAYADPGPNPLATVGHVQTGWVEARCATTYDAARCSFDYSGERFSRIDTVYRIGGQRIGKESTFDYEHPRTYGPRQQVASRVGDGIRFRCERAGSRISCVISFPARFRDFVENRTFVNGKDWGGVRIEDVDLGGHGISLGWV